MSKQMPDEARLAFQILTEIGIISQLTSAEVQRTLAPGLSQSEFSVLNHFVRVGDGKTPSRLARIFQMSKPSMTAILAKLKTKGFVDIAPSPEDGRKKIVTITRAGRRARENGIKALAPLIADFLTGFGIDRLQSIHPTLIALREYADARRSKADGLDDPAQP